MRVRREDVDRLADRHWRLRNGRAYATAGRSRLYMGDLIGRGRAVVPDGRAGVYDLTGSVA